MKILMLGTTAVSKGYWALLASSACGR